MIHKTAAVSGNTEVTLNLGDTKFLVISIMKPELGSACVQPASIARILFSNAASEAGALLSVAYQLWATPSANQSTVSDRR